MTTNSYLDSSGASDPPPLQHPLGKGLTLVFTQILPVMAIVTLFPGIPRLFAHFGADPNAKILVPMVVTIPSIFAALSAPFAGALADRFGRRPVFLAVLGLYVVAGVAPLFLNDLRHIIAGRALLGVAEGGVVAISSALIGDYFGENRYRWVAWTGVATSIAGTLLIAIGGILVDVSWRGPFAIYLAAVPMLLASLVFIDEPRRSSMTQSSARMPFPWKAAALIGSVTFVTSVLYYVEPLNIATILTGLGSGTATRVGMIQAVTSLAYILGAFLYRRLHAQMVGRLLGLACLLMGLGNVAIGLGSTELAVSMGAAIQQLGSGMVIPLLLAWGQALLPLEQRARGMGIWATAFFAGLFVCPLVVTSVSGLASGLQPLMSAFGLATIIAGLGAFFLPGALAVRPPRQA